MKRGMLMNRSSDVECIVANFCRTRLNRLASSPIAPWSRKTPLAPYLKNGKNSEITSENRRSLLFINHSSSVYMSDHTRMRGSNGPKSHDRSNRGSSFYFPLVNRKLSRSPMLPELGLETTYILTFSGMVWGGVPEKILMDENYSQIFRGIQNYSMTCKEISTRRILSGESKKGTHT